MSICYDPTGNVFNSSCPKRPIPLKRVLNPLTPQQSTAMTQASTIQRNKVSFRRNTTRDPFPLIGVVNSVKRLTFYYSFYPVTVYQIPWVEYASTQEEAYNLAYLYLQSMTYLPIQNLLFPYFVDNDIVYFLYKEGNIKQGSLPDTTPMNYAYYE